MHEIHARGLAFAAPAASWPRPCLTRLHWSFQKVILPSDVISILTLYYIGYMIHIIRQGYKIRLEKLGCWDQVSARKRRYNNYYSIHGRLPPVFFISFS